MLILNYDSLYKVKLRYKCSNLFQSQIKDAMDITTYQFANLYAWYSWPNVILPIVGGYLMDSVFGTRLGATIFAAFIIAGM